MLHLVAHHHFSDNGFRFSGIPEDKRALAVEGGPISSVTCQELRGVRVEKRKLTIATKKVNVEESDADDSPQA